MTESGFLGSVPADNSLGDPTVSESKGNLCQWDACACRVFWVQGLQTGFIPVLLLGGLGI